MPEETTPSQTQKGHYSGRLSGPGSEADHQNFREGEPFFRQILESLEDYAIFTTDLQGHVSSWNKGAENLLGYNEKEIIGESAGILFTPADIKKRVHEREMSTARKKGSAVDERYHVRKDGSQFFVSGMMFTLNDEKGKIRGFTKLMRDITHVKTLQESIHHAKQYAESIVDTAREPMLVLNKDFTIGTANRAFYNTFKVSKKTTEGKKIYDLGNGQWNLPALKALLEDILPHNTSFNDFEVSGEFNKIGQRTMLLNARKLWRVGNHTEMILLAFEDVTEKRQAERFRNAFIGVASHELRGPVSSIKGFAQILQKRARGTDDRQGIAVLEKIDVQANKLNELINHLLDISRIQSGKLQLDKVLFNLNSLAAEIVDELQSESNSHHLILQGNITVNVFADKFRVSQVLSNLIGNAVKYSPQKARVVIKLSDDKDNSICQVSVEDNGIGIPLDEQKNLFQAFARLRSAQTKKIPGIGLGLHISAEIIKEHGGTIGVESKPGSGSTFWFTLPVNFQNT